MKIAVIILGTITSLGLFTSGCSGTFVFAAGGALFGDDTGSLVAAGIVAMVSSPFVLLGGALPYAFRRTCFVLLVFGTLLAWLAFVIDLQSIFAFLYLFGAIIATIATALAGLSLRGARRDDASKPWQSRYEHC